MDTQKRITIGKNLRRIRKELGLKQIEIVGEEVTRNLISMIEHGRTPMGYKVAKIAAENMNKVCRERGSEVYIDPEDILKPERVEAKGKANQYIGKLKRCIDNKEYDLSQEFIREIISFLNEWKMPDKKVEIYELLADISYYNNDYKMEYLYLNKALENYYIVPVKKNIYSILAKLIASCITNKRYDEGLELMKLDILKRDDIPKRISAVLYYNKALIYKKLRKHEQALELLDKYERFIEENNKEMFKKALILKGTCYHIKKEYYKAIDVYKKIIDIFGEDSEVAGVAYGNMINNYIILDMKDEVMKYKDTILKMIPRLQKEDNKHLIRIYAKVGKMHEYLNNIELAEFYYICATNKAVDRKNKDECSSILFELLNLYSNTNQEDKILLSNNIFKKGFENADLSNEMKLAFSLVLTNMKLGKSEVASDIINDILKESGRNEN